MPSQDRNTAIIRKGSEQYEAKAKELAGFYVEPAVLSAIVYDKTEQEWGTWKTTALKYLEEHGWRMWKALPLIPPAQDFGYEVKGLSFQLWDKVESNQVTTAIVYRGSDGPDDWWTNFRWVTRYVPLTRDQYAQVQHHTPHLMAAIAQQHANRNFRVIAAGHSLGAGLAQQAAYMAKQIKEVFAFDSSPVTGYQTTPDPPRNESVKDLRIHRVYEKGEILSFPRSLARKFVPLSLLDPQITEVRFNFEAGRDGVSEHSMLSLADHLKELNAEVAP